MGTRVELSQGTMVFIGDGFKTDIDFTKLANDNNPVITLTNNSTIELGDLIQISKTGKDAVYYGVASANQTEIALEPLGIDKKKLRLQSMELAPFVTGGKIARQTWTLISEAKTANLPTPSASEAEVTTLISMLKEKRYGLPDMGDFTLGMNLVYDDPVYQRLRKLQDSKVSTWFTIETPTSENEEWDAGAFLIFRATVKGVPLINAAVDAAPTADITMGIDTFPICVVKQREEDEEENGGGNG